LLFSFELCIRAASNSRTAQEAGSLLFSFELCRDRAVAKLLYHASSSLLFSFELCEIHGRKYVYAVNYVDLLFSFELCHWKYYRLYLCLCLHHLAIFFWIMVGDGMSQIVIYGCDLLFSFELCQRRDLAVTEDGHSVLAIFFWIMSYVGVIVLQHSLCIVACYFLLNYVSGSVVSHGMTSPATSCYFLLNYVLYRHW